MPRCQQCGNTERFRYEVEGSEVRVFDENGKHTDTEDDVLDTVSGPACDKCESVLVEELTDG